MAPHFNSDQAVAEGWIMGERWGDAVPFAIETLDDPSAHEGNTGVAFRSDQDAYVHVVAQAEKGSAYHRAALDFLREHSPEGFDWAVETYANRRGRKPRIRVPALKAA